MSYAGKKQKTLIQSVKCSGVGLHVGCDVSMYLRPAPIGTGIVFRRTDLDKDIRSIRADYRNVTDTKLGTTVSNDTGASVSTVEHLLSAISAYGIDNLYIDIDGPEVPIMDGSASPFLFFLECGGIKELSAPKQYLRVTKTVRVDDGDKFAILSPANGFHLNFEIDFKSPVIGQQALSFELSSSFFKTEIARARTFGFAHEVEMLRKMGLARGGSTDNAIVIKDDAVINKNGLRYSDEFVRHKLLDAVGDLSLSASPIIGSYTAFKSGHDLNNKLLHALFEQEAFMYVTYDTSEKTLREAIPVSKTHKGAVA
ncbi:MAG: UDP-3-O-acyl-N-acetylglucosamine deacetylase [Pseudomonadota bacterium]